VKIRLYFTLIVFQFVVVFLVIFSNTAKFNKEYNQMVQSATKASSFSINFKKDFDYKIYRIIIGSMSIEDAHLYQDIKEAKEIALALKKAARTKGNRDRAEGIMNYLNNLYKHVDKIDANLQETGHYDENIVIWENDIQVVDSLIQDTVLEYIYYETLEMEKVRAEMDVQTMRNIEFGIVMLGVMLVGALFFSFLISNSISKPIKELSNTKNLVAQGDLTVRSNIQSGAEVKILSDSLNIMIEKLSNLIETVKTEQANLRGAELKLLQEQINPHFLYNTLDTIMWLAESGKREEVVEMVSSLSRYFRTSLSKGNDRIPLREEELHVRSYLRIQQVRYEDILEYEINIPEELGDCSIPKITLQPLVENAIHCGTRTKDQCIVIEVTAAESNSMLIISVMNSGDQIPQERLRQLKDYIEGRGKGCEIQTSGNGVGLRNIDERIKLFYGSQYGVEIRNCGEEEFSGTEVLLRLPADSGGGLTK
jgi:two-component system sensor histidine kinase YesM